MNDFRKYNLSKGRGYIGLFMAALYFGMAFVVVDFQKKGMLQIEKNMAYIFATVLVLYAIFRVYRAIKIIKNPE